MNRHLFFILRNSYLILSLAFTKNSFSTNVVDLHFIQFRKYKETFWDEILDLNLILLLMAGLEQVYCLLKPQNLSFCFDHYGQTVSSDVSQTT